MIGLAALSLGLLALRAAALPAASSGSVTVRQAQSPSTDPFYQPPAGYESQSPGTILRQRSVSAAFLGLVPDPVEAWQLLYRTTAINGSAIATVTTVFKPTAPMTDRFISFHTAYDSSAVMCDPSYTYQLGAPQTDLITSAETLILQAYLTMGYIVASPDYEGPDAAFAPGHLEGMGVLDSIRAVSNFGSTLGLTTSSPNVVGVGYSGGAIATGWAASLHPTYAPELPIKGWVSGGTPSNLTGTAVYIDGTAFSGFLPAAVDGLNKPSAYMAQLQPIISSIATPAGQSALDSANENCATGDLGNFFEKKFQTYTYQSLGPNVFYDPTIHSILQENIMGLNKNETPTAPVFMYHASQDEIIPYANATTTRDSWCSNGASVKFTTFANGGHATTEIVALPDAFEYVTSAFAGNLTSGCTQNTELNNTLDPLALGVELEPILVKLINILAAAGPEDANIKSNIKTLSKTFT